MATESSNGWNEDEVQVGIMNPEYQVIPTDRERIKEQSNDSESIKQPDLYDSVPSNLAPLPGNTCPPPLPGPRRVTSNPHYEPSGTTLSHPTTLGHHNQQPGKVEEIELESDHRGINSHKCTLLIVLSVLVSIGMVMTLFAVISTILMMFGEVPVKCSQVQPRCLCPDPQAQIESLRKQTTDLAGLIRQLNSSLLSHTNYSMSEYSALIDKANNLAMSMKSTNNTCHAKVDFIQDFQTTLQNTTLKVNLSNVGVFSNCISEYLSNCTIGLNDTSCQTSSHPISVTGYHSHDLACHVSYDTAPNEPFQPIVNSIIILESEMKCSCVTVAAGPGQQESNRNAAITCLIFRLRCPIEQEIGVTIATAG